MFFNSIYESLMTIAKKSLCPSWCQLYYDSYDDLLHISSVLDEKEVYPLKEKIFCAFELTPLNKVKVVIIGQNPYPSLNRRTGLPRAQGLAFSVDPNDSIPPSLRHIFEDIGISPRSRNGDLTSWALQGVLLLNASLTFMPKDNPAKVQSSLWRPLLSKALYFIQKHNPNVVYVLLGSEAQKLESSLHGCIVLKAVHPVAARFVGSDVFHRVNEILIDHGNTPIDWYA